MGTTPQLRVSFAEYGARPHQRGFSEDRQATAFRDDANPCGPCVELVRDFKAMSERGAELLRLYRERV